jgi:FMN phosphatase YigB (HAD superfamily)
MKTKAILFDFWGTLIENGIYPSPSKQVKYILRIKDPFPDFIKKFEESFMKTKFENLTEAFDNVINEFRINPPSFVKDKLVGMWNKNTILAKPFPETIESLKILREKGIKIGLIANTDPFSIEQVIEKYNLKDYFDVIVLSYNEGKLKSDKELFDIALEKLDVKREETIMVGDSIESDMIGAKNSSIRGVLIDRKNKRDYEDKIISLSELLMGDKND